MDVTRAVENFAMTGVGSEETQSAPARMHDKSLLSDARRSVRFGALCSSFQATGLAPARHRREVDASPHRDEAAVGVQTPLQIWEDALRLRAARRKR